MGEDSEQRWLSYDQLAKKLGVSARTIRRDVDEGKFPKPVKIRACLRFEWLEVVASLKARNES